MLPVSIQKLIESFNTLPGIGPKTSERFVFHLLKCPETELQVFAENIKNLKKSLTKCTICHQYSNQPQCSICSSSSRDKTTICVVAQSQDISSLERTKQFFGTYHVLHGTINQIDNITPQDLTISSLENRVKSTTPKILEVILATNPDMEGETTALYIARKLKDYNIKITRLARGLPMGADIGYADDITLGSAFSGRKKIS